VDEDFLGRGKAIGTIDLLAVEIDGDHLIRRGVAHTQLIRTTRANQDAFAIRRSLADMACRRLGQIQPAEHAARFGDKLSFVSIVDYTHNDLPPVRVLFSRRVSLVARFKILCGHDSDAAFSIETAGQPV
jgi:hypothetical protein